MKTRVVSFICAATILLAGSLMAVTALAGFSWSIQTVDDSGNAGRTTSLALDPACRPHISYWDTANGDVKLASFDGSKWNIETVDDSGEKGFIAFTSMAMDAAGRPHISYDNGPAQDLKYAVFNGSTWDIETVDDEGDVGRYTSLALDADGHPRISYADYSNRDLKYAAFDGSSWNIETIDREGDVGYDTCIALDADGYPHISYTDWTNCTLKYATFDGTSWHTRTIDSTDGLGLQTAIVVDGKGRPHISYTVYTEGKLKYATHDGSSWRTEVVDGTEWVGYDTSIKLDADGRPLISYYAGGPSELRFARFDGSGWLIEIIDNAEGVGRYTSLVLGADGTPHISYTNRITNILKYAYAPAAEVREIYVSPSGNDANPATKERPLATFKGARDKVRALEGDGDIVVYFRAGYYHFTEPVRLGIEDSGSKNRRIYYRAYPGERPVFTSGVQVRGWSKIPENNSFYAAIPENARDQCYVANVPDVIKNDPDKRGLFRVLVDRGHGWLERGRYSIAGQIRTLTSTQYTGAVEDAIYYSPDMKKVSELNVDITQLAMPPRGMEIMTWLSDWNIGLVPIESATKTEFGSRIRTSIAATYRLAGGARRYHKDIKFVDSALINCPEGIDGPGKWAVNPDTGRVYLWPVEGANLERDIFAPTLSELILVQGDMPEGSDAWLSKAPVNPVQYITFEGITFTNGEFLHWNDKDPVVQHGWGTCDKNDALLRFRGAKHCTVKDCTFTKSGGGGVRFDLYAQRNTVQGCTFTDLGMEAVLLCGYGAGGRDENHHNIIKDNEIGFPGRIKTDAHAINLWNSGFNEVIHNYIHDTPYTPVLIAAPRFRVLIRHVDDSVPWKDKFYMQEGAWPMTRWDEIAEVACFTATMVSRRGELRFIHQPHPDHPQYPQARPHSPLDTQTAAFRFAQGNKVQYNTFENVSRGAFGEAVYVSGTTEPGARNVVTDNYICNCTNALHPIIWMLYVDGYGRGIELDRNVIYNAEILFTGFHLAYWRRYDGWEWKEWSFEGTPAPPPARANVWLDTRAEDLIGPAPHAGTITVGCGELDEKFHQPSKEYIEDYKKILANLNEGKYPYPKGPLPGLSRVKSVLTEVIDQLE